MNTMFLRQPTTTSKSIRVGEPKRAAGKASVTTVEVKAARTDRDQKKISNAVLQYVQALRGLGKTRINSVMIADALGLDHKKVLEAVKDLHSKGVKTL